MGGDFSAEFDGDTARLHIHQVYPEDEGEYTCVAYNELGRAFTSACLVVDGKQLHQFDQSALKNKVKVALRLTITRSVGQSWCRVLQTSGRIPNSTFSLEAPSLMLPN